MRILAALFVSFLARTGRQNARGISIMSSHENTVQDVCALQPLLKTVGSDCPAAAVTRSRCRCGHRCAQDSNVPPWPSSPGFPGAPPPDSCPEGRDQTAALLGSPDTYQRTGHISGGSQIFHLIALSMQAPTHPSFSSSLHSPMLPVRHLGLHSSRHQGPAGR